MKHWIYNGIEIKSFEDIPEPFKNSFGFIYTIILEGGREYIGKKQLHQTRKQYVSDKYIEKNGRCGLKGANRKGKRVYYKEIRKQTDWLKYDGSSSVLKDEIEKGTLITKYITRFCDTKAQLTYFETKQQFCDGVLEHGDKFLNNNILGKFYRKSLIVEEK